MVWPFNEKGNSEIFKALLGRSVEGRRRGKPSIECEEYVTKVAGKRGIDVLKLKTMAQD